MNYLSKQKQSHPKDHTSFIGRCIENPHSKRFSHDSVLRLPMLSGVSSLMKVVTSGGPHLLKHVCSEHRKLTTTRKNQQAYNDEKSRWVDLYMMTATLPIKLV